MTIQDQPPPTHSDRPAIWDLVIADMRERDKVGRARYGTPLQAHNGRDALVDLSEELLDGMAYCKQLQEELKCLGSDMRSLRVLLAEPRFQDVDGIAELVSLVKFIFDRNPALGVD
jgi:hypothetical protein